MKLDSLLFLILVLACACSDKPDPSSSWLDAKTAPVPVQKTSIKILGNVQDAGSPQIGCKKKCCNDLFENPDPTRNVVALGLIDADNNKSYLFEASPDIIRQLEILHRCVEPPATFLPEAIFITHAHIGHYTGLMQLGKEAMNANKQPVYVMPKMADYLRQNGPWSQLVSNHNISLRQLEHQVEVKLSDDLSVKPFLVPHRDEFSETVGFSIKGPNKTALFIPDIDKWERWEKDIIEEVKKVDYAFLDATFYDGEELNNRDMSEIPHPFIVETMELFAEEPESEREKIFFLHFNHTNPVLQTNSDQRSKVYDAGFGIALMQNEYPL